MYNTNVYYIYTHRIYSTSCVPTKKQGLSRKSRFVFFPILTVDTVHTPLYIVNWLLHVKYHIIHIGNLVAMKMIRISQEHEKSHYSVKKSSNIPPDVPFISAFCFDGALEVDINSTFHLRNWLVLALPRAMALLCIIWPPSILSLIYL